MFILIIYLIIGSFFSYYFYDKEDEYRWDDAELVVASFLYGLFWPLMLWVISVRNIFLKVKDKFSD